MEIGVVLSTYRAPELLRRTLAGYSVQTRPADRVWIADDGSGDETIEVLAWARRELGLPIEHVWHEDDGFRKCEILNQALARCDDDYLIFSDGDCIPRADFVATHERLARPGRFLSGGYVKLSERTSGAIGLEDVLAGRTTDPLFLLRHGFRDPRRLLRLTCGSRIGAALDALTPTRPSWNGHNASGWRVDLVAANGFDERMKYGGEDRELGERLENRGVRGSQVRHRAVCVHLWHGRPYERAEDWARNRAIRAETARLKRKTTPFGLTKTGD